MMAWGRPFRSENPVAGRVVPVMHLIAFRRLEARPLTTTMEHCGGPDNDDGALSWLCQPGTRPRAGGGDAGAACEVGEAGEAYNCRLLARRAGR
jgi:hypothetical protein